MPRYDYLCRACNQVVTELRVVADRDLPVRCPSCQAPMERIWGAPAIAGWQLARDRDIAKAIPPEFRGT